MNKNLQNFFYPKSFCIVGASSKEKSIGYELLKSVKGYGYTGQVFPVNPKASEILGFKCFSSIEEITEPIDLAMVKSINEVGSTMQIATIIQKTN